MPYFRIFNQDLNITILYLLIHAIFIFIILLSKFILFFILRLDSHQIAIFLFHLQSF